MLVQRLSRYRNRPAYPRLRELGTPYPDEYAKRISGVSVKLDALARPMIEAVTNQAGMRA
jgi:hypothetical protein